MGLNGASPGLNVQSESPEATERLGAIIGAALTIGDEVRLSGEMGAGKTTLARGITTGARCEVSARSPTFVIVAEYPGPVPISHCDLYRIGAPAEVAELALDERLGHSALVIEWPENGAGWLQREALTIGLAETEQSTRRRIAFTAVGTRAAALLSRIEQGQSAETGDTATESHRRGMVAQDDTPPTDQVSGADRRC